MYAMETIVDYLAAYLADFDPAAFILDEIVGWLFGAAVTFVACRIVRAWQRGRRSQVPRRTQTGQ